MTDASMTEPVASTSNWSALKSSPKAHVRPSSRIGCRPSSTDRSDRAGRATQRRSWLGTARHRRTSGLQATTAVPADAEATTLAAAPTADRSLHDAPDEPSAASITALIAPQIFNRKLATAPSPRCARASLRMAPETCSTARRSRARSWRHPCLGTNPSIASRPRCEAIDARPWIEVFMRAQM